jgi:GAF domain-containing protein
LNFRFREYDLRHSFRDGRQLELCVGEAQMKRGTRAAQHRRACRGCLRPYGVHHAHFFHHDMELAVQPLPETRAVLHELASLNSDGDHLLDHLQRIIDEVMRAISDCVGVSIAFRDAGLTFSFVRTPDLGVLDAVQYVDDGPCVRAIEDGEEHRVDDILDEDRWQLYAQTTAAQGVRSSLSMPMRSDGTIIGSVNLYAASTAAFLGEEQALARLFRADVEDTVNNADLSMSTLQTARQGPQQLTDAAVIDQAVGVLVARHGISVAEAQQRLSDSAYQAGISEIEIAGAIVRSLQI